MFAPFLITFREVVEASLIVATMIGILRKLNANNGIKTVWVAAGSAATLSILLLGLGSLLGIKVQELYEEKEAIIEGILMVVSAIFITWAVFFLHNYFGKYKTRLLQKMQSTIAADEKQALFVLAFTAVFREGIEIVLFLSTIYFSSSPGQVFTGFSLGAALGLLVAFGLFTATIRLPLLYAFRATSMLLILFAGGMLARGIHEFAEIGICFHLLHIQYFGHIPIVCVIHLKLPEHKLPINIRPLLVIHIILKGHADLPEILLIIQVGFFNHQSFVI